jgi:tetratricopeptide (TPR) repeat protein
MRHTAAPLALSALLSITGCASTTTPEPIAYRAGDTGARHYPGFGGYERRLTTASAETQRWFNQGIQLLYGFNHDEAIRSFQEAAAHDPEAPMPYWGIAYANGININDPQMNERRSTDAYRAAQQALERAGNASPAERALINAVAQRYAWPIPDDRTALDKAYADAMQAAFVDFPDDPDIATLYAESLMNLQPWDYWTNEGEPKGRTREFVAALEAVLDAHPNHPGANHFYIHAVEASSNPDIAVPAAERLTSIVPGSGHLVHMPSHIFIRVGRYADAAQSNIDAIEADQSYFQLAPPAQFYNLYYAHNIHFLAYAAMMSGQYERAINAARQLEAEIPEEALRELAPIAEGVMPTTFHVLIRFGKWEQILEEPDYPEWRYVSRAVRRYARVIALSALGRTGEAREAMAEFEAAAAECPDDWWVFNNKVDTILPIARNMAWGELLFREGDYNAAFDHLRTAVEMEEALVYDEPPAWMLPIRHALGALLMSAGRHAEAEEVYHADLEKNRDNGWALLGLSQALEAQGEGAEAQRVARRFSEVWADADVLPTSSCYCEPGGDTAGW